MHRFTRRCKNHDYRSRRIYLITLLKSAGAPCFSSITADPGAPKITPSVELTPTGRTIYDCLDRLCADNRHLSILRRIAMPDHLHFELFVKERTEQHLGSIIAAFKASCTAKANRALFEPGFNDKIAFRKGAKDAFYNYIADNPRRYLVRKLFPEYFFHRLLIKVNDRLCGLYGNIFLLDNPIKPAIRISRIPERTPDYESKKAEWEEVIRAGGVIVSPFINPHEKKYRDEAIENGNGIILVTDYLFSDRKKPYKELFEQCASGRLLIVTTEQYPEPPRKVDYLHAQELNAIAATLAQLPPSAGRLIPRR